MHKFLLGEKPYPAVSVGVPEDEPVFILENLDDSMSFATLTHMRDLLSQVHLGDIEMHEAFSEVYIKLRDQQMDHVTVRLEDDGDNVKIILTGDVPGSVWEYDL